MEEARTTSNTTTSSTAEITAAAYGAGVVQSSSISINSGQDQQRRLLLLDVGLELLRKSQDQRPGHGKATGSSRRRRSDSNAAGGGGGGCSTAGAAAAEASHNHRGRGTDRPGLVLADVNTGIMDERILALVFRSINWDPHVVSRAACVCRRIRAVARRVLWRELCYARAPRMVANLLTPAPAATSGGGGAVAGGWPALAKLFFFCCGCSSTRHLRVPRPSPGHFVLASRFSKTSGRSFLARSCRGDLLYVSDPCEHPMITPHDHDHHHPWSSSASAASSYDVGVYRGVFCGFIRSRTRAVLVEKRAELDARVRCPYCGARVWSMTAANMVPSSAARRLGSHPGCLEYFVCVHGHLHGTCLLAHLSSSSSSSGSDDDDDDHCDDHLYTHHQPGHSQ